MASSYLSEFIDSVLNDSLNIVEKTKNVNEKILYLYILKEFADNSPTHFYQQIRRFQDIIFQQFKDRNIRIRQAAGEAFSSCLILMQQRENQKKNDFYYQLLGLVQDIPKDNRNESMHGYLIAINSFLNNSMEFCGSSMDIIYSIIRSQFNNKETYIKVSIIQILPVMTRFMNYYADSYLTREYRIEVYDFSIGFLIVDLNTFWVVHIVKISAGKHWKPSESWLSSFLKMPWLIWTIFAR